jgi:putative DNA primase/helicase
MSKLGDAALAYAKMGLPVFPLHTVANGKCSCGEELTHKGAGKHPRTPRGVLDAVTDEGVIHAWWTRWPDANIGVALGPNVGIVLDVDPRHGGDESLDKLIEENGLLPRGPTANTGGGGQHRWYAHPGGTVPIAHGFRPGLDLQPEGTYVILPPSRHPSGGIYEWVVPLGSVKLPFPPAWLLAVAEASGPRGGPRKFDLDPTGKISHGNHHDFIVSTAASLAARMRGQDPNVVYASIRAVIENSLDDAPKHTREIEEAVASAMVKYGSAPPDRPAASPSAPTPPEGSPSPAPPPGPAPAGSQPAPPAEPETPTQNLFPDGEPDRAAFVDWIMDVHDFATLSDSEELLLRQQHIYNGHSTTSVKRMVESQFRQRPIGVRTSTERFRNEVLASIKSRSYVDREVFNPPGWLRVNNGFLDLTDPNVPHFVPDGTDLSTVPTPLMFTRQQPVTFDETATCPRFLAFLEEVLPDEDDRRTVQEMFGYCLVGGNGLKLAFFWVGRHDTGKSTLLEILRGILGAESTSTVSLQSLADNKFASYALWGRLANIYTDLSPKLIRDVGLFKMLTGGSDRVPAEKKFQMPFDFVNAAKLIFSANALPAVPWGDEAFFRRWVVIEFDHQIPIERQVPRFEKVLLEAEAPGILNWMLEGLRSLSLRGHFDLTGSPGAIRDMWRRLSDSLAWFAETMVVRDRDSEVPKTAFYSRYTEFCEDQGVEARRQEEVGKELPHLLPGVHATVGKSSDRRSVRVWKGISFRPEMLTTESTPSTSQTTLPGPQPAEMSTLSTKSTGTRQITPTRAERGIILPGHVDTVDSVDRDPEDLFGPKGTRADRARASAPVDLPDLEPSLPPSPPTETPPASPAPPLDPERVAGAEALIYKMLTEAATTGVTGDRIFEQSSAAGYTQREIDAATGRVLGDGRVTNSGDIWRLKPEAGAQ